MFLKIALSIDRSSCLYEKAHVLANYTPETDLVICLEKHMFLQTALSRHSLLHTDKICLWTVSLQEHMILHIDNKICLWKVQVAKTRASQYGQQDLSL